MIFAKSSVGFVFGNFRIIFLKNTQCFFSFLFGVFDGLGFGELGAFPLCLCVCFLRVLF